VPVLRSRAVSAAARMGRPSAARLGGRRIGALVVAASATVLLAAACSGGSDGSSGGAGNGGGAGENNAFTAYTDCLKKNGVTITVPSGGVRTRPSGAPRASGFPRPSGSAGRQGGGFPGGGGFGKPAGVDDATWQKAQQACAAVRPSGRPGGNGGPGANGGNAAYRNCLRDHGVTQGEGLNTTDPATAKALAACKVLRPTASPTA
jgi:hypothetical protein